MDGWGGCSRRRQGRGARAASCAALHHPPCCTALTPAPHCLHACRYIEAITELGVAPPAGAGLYGYASLPLGYAAQHLAPPEGAHAAGQGALWPSKRCCCHGPHHLPHSCPADTPPASPGQSPVVSPQEPGSVPAAFGEPPSRAAPVAAAPPPASSDEATVHGAFEALSSLQGAPRAPTLPRASSADNLDRVASLAYGIPRVRTSTRVRGAPWQRSAARAARAVLWLLP